MKNKKKLIIIIAVVLVIVLLLVLGYIFFIKKGKLLEDYTITEISEVALTETNQQVTVNNKKINVRMFENELYVDDVRNEDLMLEGLLYVTNKYMIVADESDFGYFIEFAVDENGKTINVDNQIKTEAEYPMFNIKNFRVENGIVVGDYYNDDCALMPADSEDCNTKVEFIYKGDKLIIRDAA